MYNVKSNYKGQYINNMSCKLCKSATCDQRHLMDCSILKNEVPELKNNSEVQYNHLFASDDKYVLAIKLFNKIIRKREELLEEQQSN